MTILKFRFTFEIAGSIREIHTEVYAFGYIFSFAQDVGFRYAQVSRHWLYETTKGKFGEYSVTEESIGQRFIYYKIHITSSNLKRLQKLEYTYVRNKLYTKHIFGTENQYLNVRYIQLR